VKAFQAMFPYLKESTIGTALERLLEAGVLLKRNYNKHKYDRTLWYAFVDEETALEGFQPILRKPQMEVGESTNGIVKNHEPVPNPTPDEKPDENKEVGISPGERLKLDLEIVKANRLFMEQISLIFRPNKREITTFTRIAKHFVSKCQSGHLPLSVFKDAIGWATEAKKSTARNKKGLFVEKVKRETGFKAQTNLLSRGSRRIRDSL
jgi:hypothetical protein